MLNETLKPVDIIETQSEKTFIFVCANDESSNQCGYPPGPIKVFAIRIEQTSERKAKTGQIPRFSTRANLSRRRAE